MRVLVFAPSFSPAFKAGGPARSITNLVAEVSSTHEVVVVTADRDLGSERPFPGLSGKQVARAGAIVHYVDLTSPRQWMKLIAHIRARDYDLILLNSVWHKSLAALPATLNLLTLLRGPIVLMPRGELEPGALALKARKKRVGGLVFRGLYRHSIRAVGSTSPNESMIARQWFPGTPVLTTTNSSDPIAFGTPRGASDSLQIVALGRVHPKKGLLPLVKGLRHATNRLHVVVRGPIEDQAYWTECRTEASGLPETVTFTYGGVVDRLELPNLLWNCDLMVMLTAGENYGHTIAEALQAGCSVVTTPTTPWTRFIRAGGGEIVEDRDDPEEVAAVLDRWATKSPEEMADARLAARQAYEAFKAESPPNVIDLALKMLYGDPLGGPPDPAHGSGPT